MAENVAAACKKVRRFKLLVPSASLEDATSDPRIPRSVFLQNQTIVQLPISITGKAVMTSHISYRSTLGFGNVAK